MGALFVTGTDTGVGKTVVTSALVAALVRRGVRVGVFKPVETGCVEDGNGAPVGEDCVRLARAAGSVQSPAEVASYLFREPAAPLVAAEAESATVDMDKIVGDFARLRERFDTVVVEGAGGWRVPITEDASYAELVAELNTPVVCVVGSRLGCVNHALLTFESVERSGAELLGYVVNPVDTSGEYEFAVRTNRDLIARLTDANELGEFLRVADEEDMDALATAAEGTLNIQSLVEAGV